MPDASGRPLYRQTFNHADGEPDIPLVPCRRALGTEGPSCCWVTLPSVPPEHSPIPESLIKSGPRPLTSHFPDPQDTTQRPIKPANDAGPGMVKPLLKASCGLHSLLNPSFFRNVPASVKSGPSSSVRSRQTPDDATCSALVRIARSNGGKYLGRKCLPSQAPQWLPEPL